MDAGPSNNVVQVSVPLSNPHIHARMSGGGFFANARYFEMNQCQFYDVTSNGVSGLDHLRLYIAPDAMHDAGARFPPPRCHPGTREKILSLVSDWMGGSTDKPIMWLNGPAGCGKTTIAQTIAERYSEAGHLAASFFFSRHNIDRGTAHRLFPTLAWQLAKTFPEIAELIESTVREEPLITTKSPDVQFASLIEKPLRVLYGMSSSSPRNFIIIIDAVDECDDEHMQSVILTLIRKALPDMSEGTTVNVPVRFLICSRREGHIENAFKADALIGLTDDLSLVCDPNISEDIRKFLTHEFSRIRRERAMTVETPWPSHEVIDRLVHKSSGQFIYTSTIVKFIDARHCNPEQQLQVVLGLRPAASRQPFAELDTLYLEILDRQTDYTLLMKVLVYVVALGQPETRYVSQQLRLTEEQLGTRLGGMASLLHVSFFIENHHVCFIDFIQDATRAQKYYISPFAALRVRYPLLAKIQIFGYIAFARNNPGFVLLVVPAAVFVLPLVIFHVLISGFSLLPPISDLSILEQFVLSDCGHNSAAQLPFSSCYPGTHVIPLKLITDWINGPTSPYSIMVLRGVAGTGKSTIACTVAKLCEVSGKLTAIFFYQDGMHRNIAASLIPSFALSLAKSIPTADAYIKSTLRTDPFLPMRSIEVQVDRLIVKLFEHLRPQNLEQIAVIIDGVDLCPESSQMDKSLRLFLKAVIAHKLPLRVLVSGRTHAPIIQMFGEDIFSTCTVTLTLAEDYAPKREIQKFLQNRVYGIFQRLQITTPSSYQGDIDRLISRSADNFVYATTAVEFLEASLNPHETLRSLVDGDPAKQISSNSELDRLYITVLSGSRNKRMVMNIMASVVAVRRPLRTFIRDRLSVVSDLQTPNKTSSNAINDSLQDLRSLLRISDLYIEAHHPLLREFLQDRNRAGNFYVSPLKLLGIRWLYSLFHSKHIHFLLLFPLIVGVAVVPAVVPYLLVPTLWVAVAASTIYIYVLLLLAYFLTVPIFSLLFGHLYFLLCRRVPGVKKLEKSILTTS